MNNIPQIPEVVRPPAIRTNQMIFKHRTKVFASSIFQYIIIKDMCSTQLKANMATLRWFLYKLVSNTFSFWYETHMIPPVLQYKHTNICTQTRIYIYIVIKDMKIWHTLCTWLRLVLSYIHGVLFMIHIYMYPNFYID